MGHFQPVIYCLLVVVSRLVALLAAMLDLQFSTFLLAP